MTSVQPKIINTGDIGGFEYEIHLYPKENGVNFDIIDVITINGELETDIIASGNISKQGILTAKEILCDIHAAMALGDIFKVLYKSSYEYLK